MKEMAQEETEKIRSQMQTLEAQLEILLLPKDPLDERSIMLEVLFRITPLHERLRNTKRFV